MKLSKLILLFLIGILLSCQNKVETNTSSINVDGKYFDLSEDNIQMFFPSSTKMHSLNEFKELIIKIEDTTRKELALNQFNNLKLSKGNVYFFTDQVNNQEIHIKLIPYFLFSKKDSSKLLGMLSQSCYAFSENFENASCKKIKAGYSGAPNRSVFKAVYKYSNKEFEFYQTLYAITTKSKTFIVRIGKNNNDVNFDSYIEKIKVH